MKEKLRLVKNLLEKRSARRKEKRFVVEGPHLVEEALLRPTGFGGQALDFVVYSEELPILKKLRANGIECLKVSRKQFTEMSQVETPQGILAVVREKSYSLNDILKLANPLILFCVEVQDPANLGSMIRTADAVGVSGVILSRGCVDLYNPKVIRGTMGSLFHLPIIQVDEVAETLQSLKQKNIKLIATDLNAKKNYYEVEYQGGVAILMGNEAAGLSGKVLELSDEVVKIPMPGKAESLNVSVSTAVVLYEAVRQRKQET